LLLCRERITLEKKIFISLQQRARVQRAMPLKRTKVRLLNYLLSSPATSQELARRIKLNKTAARRHLEELVRLSMLAFRFERRGRGRPRKVYFPTPLGRELLFDAYYVVLEQLAGILAEGEAVKLFSLLGRRIASAALSGRDDKEALNALGELGFLSRLEEQGGLKRVITLNCPLLRVAQAHPSLFCEALHESMLEALLGAKATLKQTLAFGAPHCVHELGGGGPR
jgi:predicted ArsR family transcriptional regulator